MLTLPPICIAGNVTSFLAMFLRDNFLRRIKKSLFCKRLDLPHLNSLLPQCFRHLIAQSTLQMLTLPPIYVAGKVTSVLTMLSNAFSSEKKVVIASLI